MAFWLWRLALDQELHKSINPGGPAKILRYLFVKHRTVARILRYFFFIASLNGTHLYDVNLFRKFR